jgi:ribonuclease E
VPAVPDTIAPAPEPQRRRSTVREPAPATLTGEAAAPAIAHPAEPPQPVVSGPTESEDSDRPRRSGWWSKRALGKG